jgi:hypothetical protein
MEPGCDAIVTLLCGRIGACPSLDEETDKRELELNEKKDINKDFT